MSDDLDDLFDDEPKTYTKGDFGGHAAILTQPAGEGEMPTVKFQCRESMQDDSPCTPDLCQMDELWRSVGWDAVRSAGEIELVRLSARVDWTDAEEPWIDLES